MSNVILTDDRSSKLMALAEGIMEENLGHKRPIKALKNNNWVFVTTDERDPYLIKFVPKKEEDRLKTEIALNEFIRSNINIPMPKIIKYGFKSGEFYLLRTLLKGQALSDVFDEMSNKEAIFYEAGRILAKIHSQAFETKGVINAHLEVEQVEIFSQKEYTSFLNKLLNKEMITKDDFHELEGIDIDFYFGGQPNVLCHCDYGSANILVEKDKVVGIIDFEWASACPCMDDLASFELFTYLDGYTGEFDTFYKGYESIKEVPRIYYAHKDFYKFYRLITTLSYSVNVEDEFVDASFQKKMKKELTQYLKESERFKR